MKLDSSHLFDALIPLLLALHEKKVLDIAEVPHFYEDHLARRKLDQKASEADLDFLAGTIQGLHGLARDVKSGALKL
jgi:hypothetical protein